ncbi:RHS repeat protein [Pseudomonas rustica]|uniref:RHS repeat protein n=1 Tax=Pseudomonas rustica TaxID=2827099 RepID=UPI001BAE7BC6|nr:RHS repeat protein [Pseudomonas rustica]MBS4089964.1 RHS repeat protein [Pseudomonas rustica]
MSSGIDAFTPNLTATDSRGLPVRQIAYWRQDVSQREARATIQQHDAVGRLVAQQDPRLLVDASAPANLVSIYSLSGKVLSTVSVDAGWRLSLSGEADQALLGWDGRGSQRWTEYDDQIRPIAAFEHAVDAGFLCAERFAYGGDNPAFSARNQCGRLIRLDDAAGTQLFEQFGLAGEVLHQTRHFLQTLESPDWPASVSERDTLLEPGAGFTARARFNPLGEAIEQTDAKGNRQLISHAVDGLLHEVRLQLAKDVAPKVLASAIQYNALGQTVRETAGNGVITSLEYAAEDGRLYRLQSKRGSDALQDLRYVYDPVGNVLSIEDAALPVRYFANRRVEPVNRYVYDSLYQLINTTGWEAGGTNQGPTFSRFDDPASCANYSQSYRYDRGGNLLELTHDGPQSHGHRLVAAAQSNRCLPVLNGVEPSEENFRKSFDANGNLLNLQPGQVLRWDLRNQLREVRPVAKDREGYVYGADGMRVRKVRSAQTNARTLISEVRYLPGLELRTHSGTGEALQVITVQAGRSSVRVLHWESEPPKDIANDQYRYSLNDHLGSCALELDSSGDIISQERYHPFGTTAWFAGRSEIEAGYKTVRYSGQERDATGLYYYGFRYYAPWMQRWLNPDPAGSSDGLNFYVMVRNNPVRLRDRRGLQGEDFFGATFHSLDLSAQGWAKHALDKGLTATTLQRFNKATGRYSETFDYEVLEVGAAESSLAGEQVIETLAGFQKKYDELARIEYGSGKGKSPLHESMMTAAKHAERMHDFAKEAYQGDSAAASSTNKDRFFALVQRVKPDLANQQLLAVQKISMSQPDPSTHRAFVSGVVLHPLTRPEVRENFRNQPGKEAIPILQVARTFMTIKSLNKANKNTPLKDVMFGSTNSDDLKVPGRLGAKVTHEPTHMPLPRVTAGLLRR